MKKREIDESFERVYTNVEIKYPFCYKSKNGKYYFRYLNDGRYEHLVDDDKFKSIQFGVRSNMLVDLLDEDNFYFKVLANLNNTITSEEFESKRNEIIQDYHKYLNGDKYLSEEVKKLIENENNKEEDVGLGKINDYCINDEDPF